MHKFKISRPWRQAAGRWRTVDPHRPGCGALQLLKLLFDNIALETNIFIVGKQLSEVDQVKKVDFIESLIDVRIMIYVFNKFNGFGVLHHMILETCILHYYR